MRAPRRFPTKRPRKGTHMAKAGLELMVVDDDPAIRDALRAVLEAAGHSVVEADSGDRALESLGTHAVAVVLLDLAMPGINGLDALPKIREIAQDTAVIVVSGEGTVANAMKAGQRGAFDFIDRKSVVEGKSVDLR